MLAAGLSKSALAKAVRVRYNTVTELCYFKHFRFVGVRTIRALRGPRHASGSRSAFRVVDVVPPSIRASGQG